VFQERGEVSRIGRRADVASTMVRVEALRSYPEVVAALGGNPNAMLARVNIDPATLDRPNSTLSYRSLVNLLELTASELGCPDFGMRLAARQDGAKVLGPLEVAMKNSRTLGDAFAYCAEHIQAYSPATQIRMESGGGGECRPLMRFEIVIGRLPHQRQAVEHAQLLTHHAAHALSNGRSHAREVWFVHEPLAATAIYRRHFGVPVRFGQPFNALFFKAEDLEHEILGRDPQLYELASSFIDSKFPATSQVMSSQVRAVVARLLAVGRCTHEEVTASLGIHPRTLQRRLRQEGVSFEAIKDEVRRDIALRYLRQPGVSLTRVAAMVGYSEPSVLSRSCNRWFATSPRQLRKELVG
jgi:AraC-like DNA-binding protein